MILKITLNPDTPGQDPSIKRQATVYCEVLSALVEESGDFTAYYLKDCPNVAGDMTRTPVAAHLTIDCEGYIRLCAQRQTGLWTNYRASSVETVPDFPGLFERR